MANSDSARQMRSFCCRKLTNKSVSVCVTWSLLVLVQTSIAWADNQARAISVNCNKLKAVDSCTDAMLEGRQLCLWTGSRCVHAMPCASAHNLTQPECETLGYLWRYNPLFEQWKCVSVFDDITHFLISLGAVIVVEMWRMMDPAFHGDHVLDLVL